jgi:hypothetical protein
MQIIIDIKKLIIILFIMNLTDTKQHMDIQSPNKKTYIYPLKNKWCMTYHDRNNSLWREQDYIPKCSIGNLKDFWNIYNHLDYIGNMKDHDYFLMRSGISPTWEDRKNEGGKIISIQYPEQIMLTAWTLLSALILGETFCDKNYLINGLSIKFVREHKKPKKSIAKPSALIKIWIHRMDHTITEKIRHFNKRILPDYVEKEYCKDEFSIQTCDIKAQ